MHDSTIAPSRVLRTPSMVPPVSTPSRTPTVPWRQGLPQLRGQRLTLRELRIEDAPSLLAMLTTEEVARFISPPPTTVEGFERFIAWTHHERRAGSYACFAIVPNARDSDAVFTPGQSRAVETTSRRS